MLTFKLPGILSYDQQVVVDSSDYLIKLKSEIEASFIGQLTLTNNVIKVLFFVKQGDYYKGRLIINENEVPYLSGSNLRIKVYNETFKSETLPVKLNFDLKAIQINTKKFKVQEYEDVMTNVYKLEAKLDKLISDGVLKGIKINSGELVKKGMVPVAIDNKGNYIPAYPFANIIKEVNGLEAVDEKLWLTAGDIKLPDSDTTIYATFIGLSKAIKEQTNLIKELAIVNAKLAEEIKETKLKLAEHLNSGII
jgi:hypothetical protein